MALEQAQGQSTQQSEVCRSMALADAARVFAKADIHMPRQRVFDTPVPAHRLGKGANARLETTDEKTDVARRFLVADLALTDDHAQTALPFPVRLALRKIVRHG